MIAAPLSSVDPGMGGMRAHHLLRGGGDRRRRLDHGALVASLLMGFVGTFGKVFFATLGGLGIYLLMAVVLVWRPESLMPRGH